MVFALWLAQVRGIVSGGVAESGGTEVVAGPARVGFTALMESGKYTGRLLGNIWSTGNEYPVAPGN
jgi:hypothetical protein